ncbi:hypothetical protein CSHISOI_01372 [Colletotrichum shisoi]|uniref:Uncharacterized protein n=1 Tax=Colletotrichum shisoi TaxID=2078593 RepID=A0A5Q4C3Z8_9PEZI|nr:hypothetical protein CSHISOI_01372 [Colletotrichum shisoi]
MASHNGQRVLSGPPVSARGASGLTRLFAFAQPFLATPTTPYWRAATSFLDSLSVLSLSSSSCQTDQSARQCRHMYATTTTTTSSSSSSSLSWYPAVRMTRRSVASWPTTITRLSPPTVA